MHNCKATKTILIELAAGDTNQLSGELENCSACREEFAALRNALRAADTAIDLAQPAEAFWPGYHERLRQRLQNSPPTSGWLPPRFSMLHWFRQVLTTSIRVPVPVALAFVVLLVFSIFFAIQTRRASGAGSILTPPPIITKTVEVPVVRDRVVTRVVYRSIQRPSRDLSARDLARAREYRQTEPAAVTAQGLEGFKPANEAKVTIINGSYHDDK
ncbi:MAG TPA: hypothetical protein VFU37_13925 [Pyrinomonadaceae bacterium]|nr:hypothetical protein [Pyrinomonadaceae bacterium]